MKSYQWIPAMLIASSIVFPIQVTASNTQESSKAIAALVNEKPIYLEQLTPKIQERTAKYKRFNQDKEPPEELKQRIKKNVLETFITAELVYQASQKHQVTDIETKTNKAVSLLKEKDIDTKINKISIQRQIRVDEYLEAHDLVNPQLPENELKAFYEKNKSKFASKQDRVHVYHIVIKDKENGKEKIARVKQLLTDGKPFDEVAKEHSEDVNAINGGDLGTLTVGYMPKEFDAIAFNIQVGKLSDVIETEFGYHILKVVGKKVAGTTPSYESMKDFLAAGFAPKVKSNKMSAHILKLRNNATIKILP